MHSPQCCQFPSRWNRATASSSAAVRLGELAHAERRDAGRAQHPGGRRRIADAAGGRPSVAEVRLGDPMQSNQLGGERVAGVGPGELGRGSGVLGQVERRQERVQQAHSIAGKVVDFREPLVGAGGFHARVGGDAIAASDLERRGMRRAAERAADDLPGDQSGNARHESRLPPGHRPAQQLQSELKMLAAFQQPSQAQLGLAQAPLPSSPPAKARLQAAGFCFEAQGVAEKPHRFAVRADAERLVSGLLQVVQRLGRLFGVPPVMRQKRIVRGEVLGVRPFVPFGHGAVQLLTLAEQQQPVGNLLHDDVAENITRFGLRGLEPDHVGPLGDRQVVAEPRFFEIQRVVVVERAEAEMMPDHAGDLERQLLRRSQPVDAAANTN